MPNEWRGTWFEAGVGDVTITANGVPSKGECVDNVNDYYLLDNRCVYYLIGPVCFRVTVVGTLRSIFWIFDIFIYKFNGKNKNLSKPYFVSDVVPELNSVFEAEV